MKEANALRILLFPISAGSTWNKGIKKAINKFKDALVSFIIRETSGTADAENVSMY